MYAEIVQEPRFYLDNIGEYIPEATTFIMTGAQIDFLYHAFHSKIITFVFKHFYAGGGLGEKGYRYKKAFVEKIPIPITNSLKNADDFELYLADLYHLSAEEKQYIDEDVTINYSPNLDIS